MIHEIAAIKRGQMMRDSLQGLPASFVRFSVSTAQAQIMMADDSEWLFNEQNTLEDDKPIVCYEACGSPSDITAVMPEGAWTRDVDFISSAPRWPKGMTQWPSVMVTSTAV